MGAVFLVRGPGGEELALKLVARSEPQALARFERERRLLGSFTASDGFVPLLDAGASAQGAFIVMPFLSGGNLRARLDGRTLDAAETLLLGKKLARALGTAHARGVVHRDVKPENILYSAEGEPLLADLGLAKHFDPEAKGASQSASLSRSGSYRGTAGYMAPEQMEDAKTAGPPADVFSLGAVLYECLAGEPAFPGSTLIEVFERVRVGSFAPLARVRPDAPASLVRAIERALARRPRDRFPEGLAFLRALEGGPPKPRGTPVALLALVLVGLAVGVVVAGTERWRARRDLERGLGKLAARDYEGAGADFTSAIERDPRLARAWAGRATVHVARNELAGAIEDATRAIELDPSLASPWLERSCAREAKGDPGGGAEDATHAIERDPGLARAWANRGICRAEMKELDGAIADLTRAIELDAKLSRAWAFRGACKGEKGDNRGDVADETTAIELDPTFARSWGERGHARGQLGDWQGQIADSTRTLELDPKLAMGWRNRGFARGQLGDLEGKIADETKAIEVDPRDEAAWLSRGFARSEKGEPAGAVEDLTRAVTLDPRDVQAWIGRGHVYMLLNELDKAIEDETKAIELDPRSYSAWVNRGIAHEKKNDLARALEDYHRALALDPEGLESAEIRKHVAELEAGR